MFGPALFVPFFFLHKVCLVLKIFDKNRDTSLAVIQSLSKTKATIENLWL